VQTKTLILFRNDNDNKRLLESAKRARAESANGRASLRKEEKKNKAMIVFYRNDKNEDSFLKEATPSARQFFERRATPLLVSCCLCF